METEFQTPSTMTLIMMEYLTIKKMVIKMEYPILSTQIPTTMVSRMSMKIQMEMEYLILSTLTATTMEFQMSKKMLMETEFRT